MLVLLFCTIKAEDPFDPFYGYVWTTDDSSLSLCRSNCGPICCPVSSKLQKLAPTYYPFLTMSLDSQTAQRCNYSAAGYDSRMSYAGNDSVALKGSGQLVLYSLFVYYEYSSKQIKYSVPIPGGSGTCNFTTTIDLTNSFTTSSTTSDAKFTNFPTIILLYITIIGLFCFV